MMTHHRYIVAIAAALLFSAGTACAQETLRPEVGKPLQAAQVLLKSHKNREALAKVREADAVSGKTPHESFVVEQMRFVAAIGGGETEVAAKALDVLSASGKLPAADQRKYMEAVADAYFRAKDYARSAAWATRYLKEGGGNAQIRTLLIHSLYLSKDYANAAKELNTEIQNIEKSGGMPTEENLKLLASCYQMQSDNAGYASALEKLVAHYPKKEYWADLLHRIQKRPGFADRLSLDVYRLKFASGNLNGTGDYMEMAQLALQQGYPAEARKVVEQGYASGALGSGSDAERHKRLRDLVARQFADDQKNLAAGDSQAAAAKDGNALVSSGFNHALNGQFDKGIAMIEQGIAKGGLKRPEDAQLHLGIACLLAGQKAKAVQVLKTVQGSDGTADLARLWVLHAQHS